MSTFSQIYIQIVFGVKNREKLMSPSWKYDLYKYITGIVQNKGHKMIAINGMDDHIHFLIGFNPTNSISDLVREIKKSSNDFIRENKFVRTKFSWQEGYGVFSYGQSQLESVIKYINNQETHHKKRSFEEELKLFLEKYKIEYKNEFIKI